MEPCFSTPTAYMDWVNAHLGFNPRGQKQSDYLAECVFKDLLKTSTILAQHDNTFQITPKINGSVATRTVSRVVDLVIFDPAMPGPLDKARLTIENKTIMAAHGKARKNRLGDIAAYCNQVHNHSMKAIAGATVVINVSPVYFNPDGFAAETDRIPPTPKIIRETVKLFTDFPLRESQTEASDIPEALAVILVDYDGIKPGKIVTDELALPLDHDYHYDAFLKRLARLYDERFS